VNLHTPPPQEEGGKPAGTLVLVLELLCFCVGRHAYRIKYYILRNTCVDAALRLLQRREAWLGVAAIRFLRTCVGLKVRVSRVPDRKVRPDRSG